MAKADLSLTTFGNAPRKSVEVVDAYDTKALKKITESQALKQTTGTDMSFVSGTAPHLSKQVSAGAAEMGMTASAAVSEANAVIPRGAELSSVLDDFKLKDVIEFGKSYKNYANPATWAKMDIGIFKVGLQTYSSLKKIVADPSNYALYLKGIDLGGSGFGMDYLMQGVNCCMTVSSMVKGGIKDGVIGFVEGVADSFGVNVPEGFIEGMYLELVEIVAEMHLEEYLWKFIAKAANSWSKDKIRPTLKLLLQSYSKPPGLLLPGYTAEADKFTASLDKLDPLWDRYVRNGVRVGNASLFRFASTDAKEILRYGTRTSFVANGVATRRIHPVSLETKIAGQYPALYL